jgi:hypothetical protein
MIILIAIGVAMVLPLMLAITQRTLVRIISREMESFEL